MQGVGFRFAVVRAARSAGATGWVCNRDDGTVEVHVEGDDDAVAAVVRFAGRGPRGAQVERVDEQPAEATGLEGFEQR